MVSQMVPSQLQRLMRQLVGASVNVILDGTDGGGSNAGDNLILDGTDGAGANAGDKVQHDDVLDANAIPQSFGQQAQFVANTKFLNETLTIPQGVNAMTVAPYGYFW